MNVNEIRTESLAELAAGVEALLKGLYSQASEHFQKAGMWARTARAVEANTITIDGREWQVQTIPHTPPSDDDVLKAGEGVL